MFFLCLALPDLSDASPLKARVDNPSRLTREAKAVGEFILEGPGILITFSCSEREPTNIVPASTGIVANDFPLTSVVNPGLPYLGSLEWLEMISVTGQNTAIFQTTPFRFALIHNPTPYPACLKNVISVGVEGFSARAATGDVYVAELLFFRIENAAYSAR